jgi:ubiquitin conjugation factor E4 B
MLNYFLYQLAGPQRKSLTVKDPEKYEFRPKQLLKQASILAIFFFHILLLILLLLCLTI